MILHYLVWIFHAVLPRASSQALSFGVSRRAITFTRLIDVDYRKRGFRDDYDRGSELVVVEIRQSKLGPFTLDRYEEAGVFNESTSN